MQLSGILALAAWLVIGPAPASACAIVLGTAGTLALSGDARSFGSDSGGTPALLTITNGLLDPAYTVTVGAPTLSGAPPKFDAGTAQVLVSYTAIGVGVGVSQGLTAAQTSFNAPAVAVAVAMVFQNRITSSSGFAAGNYSTRMVVTCS